MLSPWFQLYLSSGCYTVMSPVMCLVLTPCMSYGKFLVIIFSDVAFAWISFLIHFWGSGTLTLVFCHIYMCLEFFSMNFLLPFMVFVSVCVCVGMNKYIHICMKDSGQPVCPPSSAACGRPAPTFSPGYSFRERDKRFR